MACGYVSSGPPRRVTLRGAIFPLNEADLAWGDAVSLSNEVAAPPLGIGLGEGCRLTRDIAKDQVLTYADVEMPQGRLCDRLRREQDTTLRAD